MTRFCREASHPRQALRAGHRHGAAGLRHAIRPRSLWIVAIGMILGSACLLHAAPKEQPSDELIYDHVIRKLVNDRELKTNQLKVTVEDAVVTVAGEVISEKLRRRVSKVVKGTRGVKKVINEVTVRE